jgi:zinc carboxypeptidase
MNNNPKFIFGDNNLNFSLIKSEVIGLSEQQRPLTVSYLDNKDSNSLQLKVFVIAGQHGDEKYGRKAATLLKNSLLSFDTDFPSIQLAVLPDANPDGSFQKTRRNAIGIDLNRDHQRLESKEMHAIHSFVRVWKPHIIIDVHNIRSKRRDLRARNLILYHDIFIDTPTNPAVNQPLDHDEIGDFLKAVQSDLKSLNFTCDKYVMLKRSGRVRHSTLDVNEALNSFSLRYGILTVLLEGRTPIREERATDRDHIISAQYHALLSILKWMQAHKDCFTVNRKSATPSKGDRFPLRSKYRPTNEPYKMIFRNSTTKIANVVMLPNNYTSKLEVTKYIELPAAYAIPSDKVKVIEILNRHGFASHFSNPSKIQNIEYYEIIQKEIQSTSEVRPSKRILAISKFEQKKLDSYIIFPVKQEGGHSLAMFLEPRSMYGLQRYTDLELSNSPGLHYPILRVL